MDGSLLIHRRLGDVLRLQRVLPLRTSQLPPCTRQAKLAAEHLRRTELEAQRAERTARVAETVTERQRDHDAVAAVEAAEAERTRREAAARETAMKALQADQQAQARTFPLSGVAGKARRWIRRWVTHRMPAFPRASHPPAAAASQFAKSSFSTLRLSCTFEFTCLAPWRWPVWNVTIACFAIRLHTAWSMGLAHMQ